MAVRFFGHPNIKDLKSKFCFLFHFFISFGEFTHFAAAVAISSTVTFSNIRTLLLQPYKINERLLGFQEFSTISATGMGLREIQPCD